MIQHLIPLYDKNLDYARLLVKDLPDARLAEQPAPKVNHPAWIIGHLSSTCDFLLSQLNQPTLLTQEWKTPFGRGSQPTPNRSDYPGKEELIDAMARGHEAVKAALRSVDLAILDLPPSAEPIRARYPVLWHFTIHAMTGHEQMHLGQISTWRRVLGFPSVY
ncbi:MAG: DinB family protein [Phycisphaeraceae bacterium]|nr:DinB family protein [Phycisphaeraceae bacterium]